MTISRRVFISGSAAGLAAFAVGVPDFAHAQAAKTLNIAVFPEPTSLIAGVGVSGPSLTVIGSIYEGLLRYDENLQPMPGLATEWSVSEDKLTYVFKLKEGVQWHDGEPFSADDVVFSTEYMRTLTPRMRVVMQHVETVTATDRHTVEFKLARPFGAFLGAFDVNTLPIVPVHLLRDADLTKPIEGNPLGTGPYKYVAWEKGSHIQLERNPNYHEAGLPTVERLYWHIIPDATSRSAAFEARRIDILPGGSVELFDVTRLQKMDDVEVTTKGWEKISPMKLMWINHRQPVLEKVEIRRALMHAIDREALANIVWEGFATAATGPFTKGAAGYTADTTAYPRDVDKARELLAAAGYAGEKIRVLPLPFGEVWIRAAEMVRQNLIQAGINAEIVSADFPTAVSMMSNWDFDLAFTLVYTYADPALGISRNYISSEIKKGFPNNNVGGYVNPRVDKLFEDGMYESDSDRRAAHYAEVQRILVDEVAAIWLLDLTYPTVHRDNVQNVISSALGITDSLAYVSMK